MLGKAELLTENYYSPETLKRGLYLDKLTKSNGN
jgi:hypothetical protein